MRKAIFSLFVLAILVASVSAVLAKGPYKAIGKNPNLNDFSGIWPTALDLKTPNGNFVQWYVGYQGDHCVCQCTDGMNSDAITSKTNEGWLIWNPSPTDPRYNWCGNHVFICK